MQKEKNMNENKSEGFDDSENIHIAEYYIGQKTKKWQKQNLTNNNEKLTDKQIDILLELSSKSAKDNDGLFFCFFFFFFFLFFIFFLVVFLLCVC